MIKKKKKVEKIATSGYLYIDPKDMEKSKIEAKKIYGDFEKPKTYSIETTPCPLCEKRAEESLSKVAKENQARVDKYGLGEDMIDNYTYYKAIIEFYLKFKCPCHKYDKNTRKLRRIEECPFKNEEMKNER